MGDEGKVRKIVLYIMSKLAGAGFMFLLFAIWIFLSEGSNLFELSETLQEGFFWSVVYAYGISASSLIDWIGYKTKVSNYIKIFLYVVAGYLFFFIHGINAYTFIAGTVAALGALIFFFGSFISKKSLITGILLAIGVPVLLFFVAMNDFTTKRGWSEERGDNSYTASFDYFNGEHEIPIQLEAGEVVQITSYRFHNNNGGGHGFHVKDKADDYVGLDELENDVLQLTAAYDGVYYLVVTGNRVQGEFTVSWEQMEPHIDN